MTTDDAERPRMFISYSWTSDEHKRVVLDLASELRGVGIDVVLDRWNLAKGDDAYAFMERMVTDASITKVLMVCDEQYASKADARAGGVGVETQIVSAELYAKAQQSKFVVATTSYDENGNAHVPAYYRNRIRIDLGGRYSTYSEAFEEIVRWAYDRPVNVPPPLGKRPAYLDESEPLLLPTTQAMRRAVDFAKSGHENAEPAIAEFFDQVASFIAGEKWAEGTSGAEDDRAAEIIERTLPVRHQIGEVMLVVARHHDTRASRKALQRFFENLLPFLPDGSAVVAPTREALQFLAWELFVHAIAAYTSAENFAGADALASASFYSRDGSISAREGRASYTEFRSHFRLLDYRNTRLRLGRSSLEADLLKERSVGCGLPFDSLVQADFLLYLRSQVVDGLDFWWPYSLVYGARKLPFEVFARSRSGSYFAELRPFLGSITVQGLKDLVARFEAGSMDSPLPRFERRLDLRRAVNVDHVATAR